MSGCSANITGQVTKNSLDSELDTFANSIAKSFSDLPPLEINSVNSFKEFKTVTDKLNLAIGILNDNNFFKNYDVSTIEATQDSWSKVSMEITRFTPLIGNYNSVIKKSNIYLENPSIDNRKNLLVETAVFGVEIAIITLGLAYKVSFKLVGTLARKTGILRLAKTNPTLARTFMSSAHWTIRNGITNGASTLIKKIS